MVEITNILEVDTPVGSSQVILFIPSKDRDGKEIDQNTWVDEGLRSLGHSFEAEPLFHRVEGCGVTMSGVDSFCLKPR
jgi:hypothetical protein